MRILYAKNVINVHQSGKIFENQTISMMFIFTFRTTTSVKTNNETTIPRSQPPTMVTAGRDSNGSTDLTATVSNEEYHDDTANTNSSPPSKTYNPIYRKNEASDQHEIFDTLHQIEDQRTLPFGALPSSQGFNLIRTLNSFRHDSINNPFDENSTLSDFKDLDEIEFSIDMLDDMIKYDEVPDEFMQVINPNFTVEDEISDGY